MMKIYFAGQDNFGNRGCEALVRSSVDIIRREFGEAGFAAPSWNPTLDARQWPQAHGLGVSFVDPEPFPSIVRWWGRLRRRLPFLPFWEPKFEVSRSARDLINQSDVLIMTGGDIISLDYGPESLFYWAGVCRAAKACGKPAVLWAASVGPFGSDKAIESAMVGFLREFDLITVREDASLGYLRGLGIEGVQRVSDPAFCLAPDAAGVAAELTDPRAGFRRLGFNISPVIRKFRDTELAREALDKEVVDFLVEVANQGFMDVTLIPHVDPLDGTLGYNSDSAYMAKLLEAVQPRLEPNGGRVQLLPAGFNAAQLKHIISRCDFFMGGRTHATVAALSTGVPTTSIAYSIKAKGINKDVFGHDRYVLPTPEVARDSLSAHLKLLIDDEQLVREHLKERKPHLEEAARLSAVLLRQAMQASGKTAHPEPA